jgi:hypothetical protein
MDSTPEIKIGLLTLQIHNMQQRLHSRAIDIWRKADVQ